MSNKVTCFSVIIHNNKRSILPYVIQNSVKFVIMDGICYKRYIPVESELFAESEVVAVELEEAAAVSRLVTFDCNVVFSSFKDSTCFSNSFICPS